VKFVGTTGHDDQQKRDNPVLNGMSGHPIVGAMPAKNLVPDIITKPVMEKRKSDSDKSRTMRNRTCRTNLVRHGYPPTSITL